MMESARRVPAGVARVFVQQPDRMAAAWRRLRAAEAQAEGARGHLLDTLVEPFVRELGRSLAGEPTSPWSRTRAVLRVSRLRGARGLAEEFSTLRRCLVDALEALGGSAAERAFLETALEEANACAAALLAQRMDPHAPAPPVPFGGVVVELYERADEVRRPGRSERGRAPLH